MRVIPTEANARARRRLRRYAAAVAAARLDAQVKGVRSSFHIARAVVELADREQAEVEGILNHERDVACASIQAERVAAVRRAEAAEAQRDDAIEGESWAAEQLSDERKRHTETARERDGWKHRAETAEAEQARLAAGIQGLVDGTTMLAWGDDIIVITDPDHPIAANRIPLKTWLRDLLDDRPCKGNANVCAAEGCFGVACSTD